jgi:transcriptional regulator with XRE-family HTH domain
VTEGERLRAVRKHLGLTLDKFGEKLGMKKSALSLLENGVNNFTDQVIRSICREYKVNYDWLVRGEGEMFEDLSDTILDELCIDYNCDDMDRKIIKAYLDLDDDSKRAFKNYLKKLLDE